MANKKKFTMEDYEKTKKDKAEDKKGLAKMNLKAGGGKDRGKKK